MDKNTIETETKKYPVGTRLKIDTAGYQNKTYTVSKITELGFTLDADNKVLYWFDFGALSHYSKLNKLKVLKEVKV